jgi:glycerophosphoryl diester phosphodiesterase
MTKTIKKITRVSLISLSIIVSLAVSTFYIFRLPPSPYTAHRFMGQEIAHRGGYELGPENTLSTILLNLEKGARAFEVDVQLSADGIPVLYHDSTLKRLTGHPGKVGNFTAAELQKLPILDENHEATGTQMATLEELLDTLSVIAPEVLLELDLKFYSDNQDELLENVLELVHRYDAGEHVLFSSFDPTLIYKLRKMDPEVLTGFAHTSVSGEGALMDWMLNLALVPKFLGVAAIEPQQDLVDQEYVDYWTRRGLAINAWTANEAEDKKRLHALGVTITTNCPNEFCDDREEDLWGVPEKVANGSRGLREQDAKGAEAAIPY